jgi:hypothetical protein
LPKTGLPHDCLTTIESSLRVKGKAFFTIFTVCKVDCKLYYQLQLGSRIYKLRSFDKIDRIFFFWGCLVGFGTLTVALSPKTAFLDPSGIEFPHNRTQHFWDSTDFGRAMRQQYFQRVDHPFRIMDRDL